ncbi:MAG: hypothetical protein K6A23_00955 [Butyrivibrio sp.]|nr:hypothetical protein [Butyrivibrio sp.]
MTYQEAWTEAVKRAKEGRITEIYVHRIKKEKDCIVSSIDEEVPSSGYVFYRTVEQINLQERESERKSGLRNPANPKCA